MVRRRYGKFLASILAIGAAVVLPILGSGLWNLGIGDKAANEGDYRAAANSLELAARGLPWRVDLWERAGMYAYAAQDFATTVRLLKVSAEKDSLSVTGWDVLGYSLWTSGQPEEAITVWADGAARSPTAPVFWDRLAAAHHALGELDAEESALRKRLELKDEAMPRYRLGLLLMLSDPGAALQSLDRAAALDADVKPAVSTLRAALFGAAAASGASERHVMIGHGLGLVNEWELAGRAFDMAVKDDKANAEARAWRGEALQHLGQDGRPDLDAAFALNRDSSVVHTLRGLYWRRQGLLGLSLVEYKRAAELDPKSAALQSLVGEAYAASGDLVAALDAYENAVELDPLDSNSWRLLALFCADNDVQVLDVGVAAGLKAVELAPNDSRALDALGWAYAQAGYLLKAEQSLLHSIEADPGNAEAHLHLGLSYLRWGQNEKALQHWNEAVRIDGQGPAGRRATQLINTYFPSP